MKWIIIFTQSWRETDGRTSYRDSSSHLRKNSEKIPSPQSSDKGENGVAEEEEDEREEEEEGKEEEEEEEGRKL